MTTPSHALAVTIHLVRILYTGRVLAYVGPVILAMRNTLISRNVVVCLTILACILLGYSVSSAVVLLPVYSGWSSAWDLVVALASSTPIQNTQAVGTAAQSDTLRHTATAALVSFQFITFMAIMLLVAAVVEAFPHKLFESRAEWDHLINSLMQDGVLFHKARVARWMNQYCLRCCRGPASSAKYSLHGQSSAAVAAEPLPSATTPTGAASIWTPSPDHTRTLMTAGMCTLA